MPDDLYDTDILAWSQTQAARLRRIAAGERVNDVDWPHVIEEVEDVGRSELRSVQSNLRLAFLHALKLCAWPEHESADHWAQELSTFLGNARDRFEPGMQRRVDPEALYARALQDLRELPMRHAPAPLPLPERVRFTARELRGQLGAAALVERIRAAAQPPSVTPDTAPARPPPGTPRGRRSAD
jgi:hypothetical protein